MFVSSLANHQSFLQQVQDVGSTSGAQERLILGPPSKWEVFIVCKYGIIKRLITNLCREDLFQCCKIER